MKANEKWKRGQQLLSLQMNCVKILYMNIYVCMYVYTFNWLPANRAVK